MNIDELIRVRDNVQARLEKLDKEIAEAQAQLAEIERVIEGDE